ncbi:hypothetical protein [Hyalangium gracile]|uniref:hypothetical protein n=1 Tax=Hyalangium gracile TaxID=394092 RepID=UPI001CCCB8D4|nr:hypothetical protein [Hyalangium gracile]
MSFGRWAAVAMVVSLGCASPRSTPLPQPRAPAPVPAPAATGADATAPETEAVSPATPVAEGCPSVPPIELGSCKANGLRCTYADTPECGAIWECYLGQWYARARGSCSSQFEGVCPRQAGAAPEGVSARSGIVCIYPEGVACAYRADPVQPECSGVARALPPPAPPTYRCEPPGPAACVLGGFRQGGPCEPDGVSCGPACCGLGGVCVQGEWQLEMRPCPQ